MSVLGRWQLTPVHLDIVCKYLGIERLTAPISTRSFGRTADELGRAGQAEYPNMEAAGVIVDDEVAPPLVEALQVIAKPYFWVDSVWFPQPGTDHCWRALAAFTDENRVVLGVQAPGEEPQRGGLLTVEVHQNVPLPAVVLGTLPPAKPGTAGVVRVPHSSLNDERGGDDYDPTSMMQSATPQRARSGDRQVALLEQVGKAPHVRLGQLAANRRDQYNRRNRSKVVAWFDNAEPDGRYVNKVERSSTGETVHALLPADARTIGGEIDGLINSLR